MTRILEPTRKRSRRGLRRPGERGAALVVAILVLTILTVIGIALMLITSTESRIAANEWSVNRAFYSADAGLRWASAAMQAPSDFMRRPEFCTWANPTTPPTVPCPDLAHAFGTVIFPLPSFRAGPTGFFSGDTGVGSDITVRVQSPSLLGRRLYRGGRVNEGEERGQYTYGFEVRSAGGNDLSNPILQYSKALVTDVELGPMPARLPFSVTP